MVVQFLHIDTNKSVYLYGVEWDDGGCVCVGGLHLYFRSSGEKSINQKKF